MGKVEIREDVCVLLRASVTSMDCKAIIGHVSICEIAPCVQVRCGSRLTRDKRLRYPIPPSPTKCSLPTPPTSFGSTWHSGQHDAELSSHVQYQLRAPRHTMSKYTATRPYIRLPGEATLGIPGRRRSSARAHARTHHAAISLLPGACGRDMLGTELISIYHVRPRALLIFRHR